MSNCVVGSGGLRLPNSIIAEKGVKVCDHFSHDGDDDDLGFLVGGGEAIVEGLEGVQPLTHLWIAYGQRSCRGSRARFF